MKIAVNTRLLRKNAMDGIGWFTYNTIKKIAVENPGIEFHFFFDSGVDKSFLFSSNIVPHNLFPPAKHALLNIAWFEWSVKRKLQHINPNLFLSPDGILCLGWQGKQYGVIHDLNFLHMPEVLKYTNRKYYNFIIPKCGAKAARIGTVSHYSKNDLVKTLGINENKIDVVYSGINSFYHPVSEDEATETRLRFAQGCRYFVFVGTLSPRKNILKLMEAFDAYKKNSTNNHKLLIVGKGMYKKAELLDFRTRLTHSEDIVFTGRLPDEDVKKILASAICLVFIPIFEGFGLPPIEAMQCNVPVIASNVTSVPEICGDAALIVDPYNTSEIAAAMASISENTHLREQLILKGRVRKDFFSWNKTADLLWESVNKIL
ncbi:MAG: glycosyltransferase family 4 protein [Agriterribacter sp.]